MTVTEHCVTVILKFTTGVRRFSAEAEQYAVNLAGMSLALLDVVSNQKTN